MRWNEQQPDRRHQRPGAHEQTRAEAIGERAEALGESEHDNRRRQGRQAALKRRVAADLLQEDRQEEEQDRQARIHRQRLDVPRREVAPAKERERQHRIARARLVHRQSTRARRRPRPAGRRPPGRPNRAGAARSARTPGHRDQGRKETRRGNRSFEPLSRRGSARGITARISVTQIATSGRLIRKITRQEEICSSSPPASGPSTVAIPPQAVQLPIAGPRSDSRNVATITARALGVSSAPATPCRARAAINAPIVGASAHSSDATPKPPTPSAKMRRSPYRSPSDPPTRISEPSVSR